MKLYEVKYVTHDDSCYTRLVVAQSLSGAVDAVVGDVLEAKLVDGDVIIDVVDDD